MKSSNYFFNGKNLSKITIPPYNFEGEKRLPFIPLGDQVLFSGSQIVIREPLKLNAHFKKSLLNQKLSVIIGASKINPTNDKTFFSVYATEAIFIGYSKENNGDKFPIFLGVSSVVLTRVDSFKYGYMANLDLISFSYPKKAENHLALKRTLTDASLELIHLQEENIHLKNKINSTTDTIELCDLICPLITISLEEKISLLGSFSILNKLKKLIRFVYKEHEIVKLSNKIKISAKGELQDEQRKHYLREQLHAIQRELGEEEQNSTSLQFFEEHIEDLDLGEISYNLINEEIERFSLCSVGSPDYSLLHSYLSFIFELPWKKRKANPVTLSKATKILNNSHSGLSVVKDRILEYIATIKHSTKVPGQILLLNGPPGVGKTSLASSIAESLNRPFARVSLAGLSDEAELRGHRKTYVGAMPGKIIQSIKQCQSTSCVILLDEIDKMGNTSGISSGEASLLEILDPEQNERFIDNYLSIPFDLSNVVFIATSNNYYKISEPLRDRLEIIDIRSYTQKEKIEIAGRHIIPEIRKEFKLNQSQLNLSGSTLLSIIDQYTREAGVRNLKKILKNISRKIVKKLVEGKKQSLSVNRKNLTKWIGTPVYLNEPLEAFLPPGVSIGLAYTDFGGDILYIESSFLPTSKENKKILLTGNIGKVMEESALTVLTYLSNHLEFQKRCLKNIAGTSVHLHLPDGATPKDGPSGGIAIMCSLASLFTQKPLNSNYAFTGEVTLRGQVLAVGGIREKVIAAHRYKKDSIMIPLANLPDIADVPKEILKSIDIIPVRTMEEVLYFSGILKPYRKTRKKNPKKVDSI